MKYSALNNKLSPLHFSTESCFAGLLCDSLKIAPTPWEKGNYEPKD